MEKEAIQPVEVSRNRLKIATFDKDQRVQQKEQEQIV